MLALAAASALSKILHSKITFSWENSPVCPCEYSDLFKEIPGLKVNQASDKHRHYVKTDKWNPIRILNDFKQALRIEINEADYYHKFIKSLRAFEYNEYVTHRLSDCIKKLERNNNLAIHIRRTDRITFHKKVYIHKLFAIPIIRNTGIGKSLQYLLLPDSLIRRTENKYLFNLLKKNLACHPDSTYSLYSDSQYELEKANKYFIDSGIHTHHYHPGYCDAQGNGCWKKIGNRHTSMQDALIDLLEMSNSNRIAQNNPASTFALVSSIIGCVKIVSKQPMHEFWRKITTVLGEQPNAITN